jgi:hypothetical protein
MALLETRVMSGCSKSSVNSSWGDGAIKTNIRHTGLPFAIRYNGDIGLNPKESKDDVLLSVIVNIASGTGQTYDEVFEANSGLRSMA